MTLRQKIEENNFDEKVAFAIEQALCQNKYLWVEKIRRMTPEDKANLLVIFPPLIYFFNSANDQFFIVDDNLLIKVFNCDMHGNKGASIVARLKEIDQDLEARERELRAEIENLSGTVSDISSRRSKVQEIVSRKEETC